MPQASRRVVKPRLAVTIAGSAKHSSAAGTRDPVVATPKHALGPEGRSGWVVQPWLSSWVLTVSQFQGSCEPPTSTNLNTVCCIFG